jgi:hypothetical protein
MKGNYVFQIVIAVQEVVNGLLVDEINYIIYSNI